MSSTTSTQRVLSAIAKHLTSLRETHGLTHQEVGDALGVTMWTSMRWCQGRNAPSVEQLCALAKLYRVDIHELLEVA